MRGVSTRNHQADPVHVSASVLPPSRTVLRPALLAGRSVVVTGAAGGIGVALTTLISSLGARVFAVDRPENDFAALRMPIARVSAHPCDLADSGARAALVETIAAKGQGLDGLVNNAGLFRRLPIRDDVEAEHYAAILAVNAVAADDLIERLTPLLRQRDGSAVVNIASVRGLTAPWRAAAYGLSKAAILVSTRDWAVRLAPDGIRVNAIAPGDVRTPMNDIPKGAAYMERIPLGRFAVPDEIAGVAAFLLSPLSAGLNGVTLPVDGGFLAG